MDEIRVYTAESAIRRPWTMIRDIWKDISRSRELAWRLAIRDVSAAYRQSYLGILWAFIIPLSNALVWILLRGAGVVSVAETGIPYPVYAFSGTMLWAIFTESLLSPLQKTVSARGLLTKINFPREGLILSGFYQAGFNATIKAVLIIIGVGALGYIATGWGILLFPIGICSLMLAGTSIGLLLTPIGMLYTDIAKGLSIAMQFLMYATPVVFPMPKEGWIATLISYNPITPLVMTTRAWLTGGTPDLIEAFILVSLASMALLFLGLILYRVAMPFLIERMSA